MPLCERRRAEASLLPRFGRRERPPQARRARLPALRPGAAPLTPCTRCTRRSGVVCADQVCTDKEALRPVHAWACADLSFEAHSLQSLELSFWRRRRWAPHSLLGRATVPLEPDAACGAIGAAPWRPLQARGGGKELRVALTWTDSEKPTSPPASIAAGTEEAPPADQPAAAEEEPSWATF